MATTDLERLIVSLEASTVKYERALARANAVTNIRMRGIERRVGQAAGNIGQAFNSAFTKGLALAGGSAALTGAKNLIDSSIKIENSLKIAGLAGEELNAVYAKLFASAQRNAAPLEALATLYGRVAQVQGELGISSDELAKFTDNIAVALRVSGRTAEESRGALLQLGQALGGTIVRAEEFNSINEGALPVLQAVARGLTEAGGSVAKLRALVIDGKVSSQAFFRAFEAGSVTLENQVKSIDVTIDQSFTKFINVLTDIAGEFNEDTNLAGQFAAAMEVLGDNVKGLTTWFLAGLPAIDDFFGAIVSGIDDLKTAFPARFAELWGLDKATFGAATSFNDAMANMGIHSNVLNMESTAAGNVLRRTFELTGATPQDEELARLLLSNRLDLSEDQKKFRDADYASVAAIVKPVSLADFTVPSEDKAAAKKAEKDRQRVKDMIADLQFEKSIIGETEVAKQKLNAVRQAGAAATEAEKEQIAALTESIYYEQEAVQYLHDLYDALGDAAQSAIQGIIGALDDGTISAEEFSDVLSNLLGQVGNFFLSQAFGSGTNGFSNILGSIFGGARANGGPVQAGKVYKVNENTPNSEYFAPTQDGVIIPRLPTGAGGASSRGNNVFHIDARGAQLGVGAEIERALQNYDRHTLPGRVNQINRDPLARG